MKIEHNKKLFYIIIFLIILLIILIFFILKNKKIESDNNISNKSDSLKECYLDTDCVPKSCCHATACVSKEKTPECKEIFCTAVCSGPLDCGAGYCGCVNEKCEIVKDK